MMVVDGINATSGGCAGNTWPWLTHVTGSMKQIIYEVIPQKACLFSILLRVC
jgi:hypothetical protein